MTFRIGICGYATSGKDVMASVLVEYRWFTRINMSDPLLRDLRLLNPLVDPGEGDAPQRLDDLLRVHSFEELKRRSPDFRSLLQRYGTDVWRAVNPNTWVERVATEAARFDRVVTTGIRFLNEMAGIDVLIHVERPGVGPVNGHVSDAGIGEVAALAHHHVLNDGSVEDLRVRTLALADQILDLD